MRKHLKVALLLGLSLFAFSKARAAEALAAGVKVVSDKNPDASTAETIFASILKPGMSDQQKCEALFDYLVVRTYHHNCPEHPNADGLQQRKYFNESTKVMDAIKALNVYGHALCGSTSWYQNYLFNAMGLPGRINGVNGHTVPEIKYDGKWHYFDVDMMGYVRKPDGTVASVDEIKADKELLLKKTDKTPAYYYKFDGAQNMWGALNSGVKYSMYGRKFSAHSMNLTLREGESLTRYFKRQWAPKFRYYCPAWPGSEYLQRLKQNGGQGPQRPETHYLFMEAGQARFGNWELAYAPPLAKKSCLDGFFALANVAHSDKAPFLKPEKAGAPSEAVIKYYSPYLCAGCPNDLAKADDNSDGAVFEGEFANANGSVFLSLDLGKSWDEVHKGGGKFKLDLTPKLETRAGWLLKLAFQGDGAGVSSFKSYISGQLSPAMLPFVNGKTKMTFTRADTDCLVFEPDLTLSEAELRRVASAVEGYAAFSESISGHHTFVNGTGSVTFKVDAPGDIVRVQTAAKFGGRKGSSMCGVSFSIDDGKTWVVACDQTVIKDEDHPEEFWGQCVDGILDFEKKKAYSPGCVPHAKSVRESSFEPKPVKSVQVKIHTRDGDCSLIGLEGIYVHYKKPGALPITITHKWTGGEHVEKIKPDEASKTYDVDGGKLETNESIKMEAGGQ